MTHRRGLVLASSLAVTAAAAGCGPPVCPAGESTHLVVVDDARCSGSVTAPASLNLPSTIPAQCVTDQTNTCALVNACIDSASPCSRICLQIDPLSLDIGLTGLPFAGAVSLPDPRVEATMGGAPAVITSGTMSETQSGSSLTASFSMDITPPDGGTVEITSARYSLTSHNETQCSPN